MYFIHNEPIASNQNHKIINLQSLLKSVYEWVEKIGIQLNANN